MLTFKRENGIITVIFDWTDIALREQLMEPYIMTEEELNLHNALYDKADAKVEEEIAAMQAAENSTENRTDGKAAKRKSWKVQKFSFRGLLANMLILALIMSGVTYGLSKYMTLYPYAVVADDEVICYVDSKSSASEAVQKAVGELAAEDSDVVSVSVGDNSLSVERSETRDVDEVLSVDEAADRIIETAKSSDKGDGITVVSRGTETRTFTPEPQYEMDNTALAGTTTVMNEGKDGKEQVSVTYVTVDGEVENKTDVSKNVVEDGESAVIVKGTLGVPDGESWETYEGSPVFNSGDDLIVTAQQYAGKVPYVRGGTSLATGVDCVGFVRAIYKLYGVNLSAHLKREGYKVSYKDAQPGDILCFQHHYGIYIGNGKMVHAANPKQDVLVSSVSAGTNLQQVRRIPRQ